MAGGDASNTASLDRYCFLLEICADLTPIATAVIFAYLSCVPRFCSLRRAGRSFPVLELSSSEKERQVINLLQSPWWRRIIEHVICISTQKVLHLNDNQPQ